MGWKPRTGPALPRIYARAPKSLDETAWLALMDASLGELRKWGNAPSGATVFRRLLDKSGAPNASTLFVFEGDTGDLAGVFNITNIIRGPLQGAFLGYYANSLHAGRGYMTAGFGLLLDHAFSDLGLHRLEANVQPENERSKALLDRVGFRCEGFSPRYLHIKGEWRDHERWAITVEGWEASHRIRT